MSKIEKTVSTKIDWEYFDVDKWADWVTKCKISYSKNILPLITELERK